MAQLQGASITYRVAVGPQQGRKVFTLQTLPACDEPFDAGVGKVAGFSLHAGVAARADERKKLEPLCRYISRPAVAEKRLSLTPNGNVRYNVKGFTSVADAWMRRSELAENALPRRHDTRCLTPGILPSGLRASLRLIQIAPGDLVGIDIDLPGLCRGCADHCVYRRSCGDREDPHTLGCEDG
jgi:hypothetical protein